MEVLGGGERPKWVGKPVFGKWVLLATYPPRLNHAVLVLLRWILSWKNHIENLKYVILWTRKPWRQGTLTATGPGGAVAGARIWASCVFVEVRLLIKRLGLWVDALQCLTLQMHTVSNRGVDVCGQIPNWSACICHLEICVCDWLVNEKTHYKSVQTDWTRCNFIKHHYLYHFFLKKK